MANHFASVMQGHQMGQQNRLGRLAGEAYTAPMDQRNSLLGQMAQISPQAAQAQQGQFDQQEDRTAQQLRGYVQYVNSAREQNNPAAVNAALRAGSGLIERLTGKPGPTEWTPDMDAGWAELEARVAMSPAGVGGAGVQSTYVDGAGNRVAIMRDGSTQILGKNDAGATQQTISITGPDGRPAQYTFDRRTGSYVPAGASMGGAAPQPAAASPGVTQFSGPDGMPVQIGDDIPDHVRQQILANPAAFQEVPDGSTAQMPDRPVQQFTGGNQLQTSQRVVSGPSAFVGQSPAEKAASEAAARAQVELSYAPALQQVQTQGAIDRARGEAQIQTESTLQRDEAKRQAERVQGLPQLQEQRRVLNDALQGLGTKYRTGPINTVIPDALQSADNQVFMTVVNNAVLDAASKLTGVISDKDMEFLRRATVNLDTREDANREILRRQLRIIDEGIQKAQSGGGTQSSGSAAPAVQRARNPQTGEVLELRNGQWVPAR